MDQFALRPLKNYGADQYEVVRDGEHVGRIYLANPHSIEGYNWFWGVNWFARPKDKAHLPGWDGFAEGRGAAMAAFRKAWDMQSDDGPPVDEAAN